jgi:hypothetical protein
VVEFGLIVAALSVLIGFAWLVPQRARRNRREA